MAQRDFFIHLDETLVFTTSLKIANTPIVLADHLVEMAISKQIGTNTIIILSSANTSQISTVAANTATVSVTFKPTKLINFSEATHLYQLRATNTSTNVATVMLEGKIFIDASLFD